MIPRGRLCAKQLANNKLVLLYGFNHRIRVRHPLHETSLTFFPSTTKDDEIRSAIPTHVVQPCAKQLANNALVFTTVPPSYSIDYTYTVCCSHLGRHCVIQRFCYHVAVKLIIVHSPIWPLSPQLRQICITCPPESYAPWHIGTAQGIRINFFPLHRICARYQSTGWVQVTDRRRVHMCREREKEGQRERKGGAAPCRRPNVAKFVNFPVASA